MLTFPTFNLTFAAHILPSDVDVRLTDGSVHRQPGGRAQFHIRDEELSCLSIRHDHLLFVAHISSGWWAASSEVDLVLEGVVDKVQCRNIVAEDQICT